MSVALLDIVLFSHDGQRRTLTLRPGAVNIITGASRTGKSSLIDIVDYCFGADQCRVPDGIIREAVAWFGVRLKLGEGQAFIARRCPTRGAQSSEECFVELGGDLAIPDASQLRQTTNSAGLRALLTRATGVDSNLHEPPEGQTRPPLSATIRHALALCFQPQDEIIRRQQLFHGTDNTFAALALKDALPYFLGAVDADFVQKHEQLRRVNEQLRKCERELAELSRLRGNTRKAATLLAQARAAGLVAPSDAGGFDETIASLKTVAATPLASVDAPLASDAEYARLSSERARLLEQERRLQNEASVARAFETDEKGFSIEATEQRGRLRTIGIFEGATPGHSCPLCSQELREDSEAPSTADLKETLGVVSARLAAVEAGAPRLQAALGELQQKLLDVRQALATNRAEMEAVRSQSDRLSQLVDDSTKRALVIGRVSLYVESLPAVGDATTLEAEAQRLKAEKAVLEEQLSDERVRDRLDSIASVLGQKATEWARYLDLEHSGSPFRIDFNKLTVVADTPQGPVPMERMGSGANWVGCHLIAHLALHYWFATQERPVPRFLFLDQPSQIYFPPEPPSVVLTEVTPTPSAANDQGGQDVASEESVAPKPRSVAPTEAMIPPSGTVDEGGGPEVAPEPTSENDREAALRMFKFVFDAVALVAPELQVVITEHADLDEVWFQEAVVEKWRNGPKLVPETWPRPGVTN